MLPDLDTAPPILTISSENFGATPRAFIGTSGGGIEELWRAVECSTSGAIADWMWSSRRTAATQTLEGAAAMAGGSFTGDCSFHDGDQIRRLVIDANSCFDYRLIPNNGQGGS